MGRYFVPWSRSLHPLMTLRTKRLFDLALSSILLVVLSPLLIIVSVLIRLLLGAPILFRQERPGFDTKIFTCLKFRTMTDARDANGELLPDSRRLRIRSGSRNRQCGARLSDH